MPKLANFGRRYRQIDRKKPPPRGDFLFTMFPHQELCVIGPPSKDLYQVLLGGSSYTRFLMRENSKHREPSQGGEFLSIKMMARRYHPLKLTNSSFGISEVLGARQAEGRQPPRATRFHPESIRTFNLVQNPFFFRFFWIEPALPLPGVAEQAQPGFLWKN